MRSIATEPKKAEGNEIQSMPELWRRLTQQEQHLRVRIKVEGDLEARAAGQGIPVMVAYHRSVVMHHEGELKTLLWIMEAAQEQMAELADLRAQNPAVPALTDADRLVREWAAADAGIQAEYTRPRTVMEGNGQLNELQRRKLAAEQAMHILAAEAQS